MKSTDTVSLIFPLAISALGAILNFMSMSAILSSKTLRRGKNIFTFHLSLCDFIGSMGVAMEYLSRLHPRLTPSKWTLLIFAIAMLMSLLSTLAIAMQRFIIFRVDPFGNRDIITARRSILVCVVGWFVVSAIYYTFTYFRYEAPIIGKAAFISTIWIAMVLTTACYGIIYQRITAASRGIGQSDGFLQQRVKVHQRIILTFGLVVGSTCMCWIPWSIVEVFVALQYVGKDWFKILDRIAFNILCLNQVLNPIIFWSRLTEFRDQLRGCRRGDQGGLSAQEITDQTVAISVISMSVQDSSIVRSP